ncbi:retrotransposon protein, putative, ty1-copia subclass [Tanacetum coccineum]
MNDLTSDFTGFVRNYNMHNMGKTIGELYALLIVYEKGLPKKAATPQVMAIQGGRIQKANKKSLNAKGKGGGSVVGHWKRNCPAYLAELIKKKKQVGTASSSCIFTIELFSFPNKSWVYDTGCGTHICNTKQGLRRERKLKQGALYLYVGNGVRAHVEAIEISKNDVLYFNAIPCNGIYEIDMLNLVLNVNSIYDVSNKRAKHNLNTTYLWHCRLAHISKKRIEKLQHGGILKLTNEESFDKCVSCLSGKITRKPFSHRTERATDLLGLIHTDMCCPLRHVSRQDRGGEYISQEFKDYLKACGIVQQLTPPYTPQHNSVSERRNRTLLDMVRSMMNLTRYPKETMGYYFYFPPENKIVVARTSKIPIEKWRSIVWEILMNLNYKAELLDSESDKWLDAMNAKIQSMKDNQVWRLVDLPPNSKTVGSKWIFKKKTDMNGIVHTYRVDYEETFSPVADIKAIRILIAIAAFYDYEIWKMDVKTAFLNGYLDENIYMVQPKASIKKLE